MSASNNAAFASENAMLSRIVSPSFTTYTKGQPAAALPRLTQPKRPSFRAADQHCLFTTTTHELGRKRPARTVTAGPPSLGLTGGFTAQFSSMYRDTSLSSLKQLLARAELQRRSRR